MSNTNFQTIHQMGNAISNVMKQAMGRENVQNIDMDFVTVAQRTRWIEHIVSGDVVTFETNMVSPLNYLITNIFPVQNLHGYDNSWIGGAGKNLLNNTSPSVSGNGQTFTLNSDGTVTVTGTATGYTPYEFSRLEIYDIRTQTIILNGLEDTTNIVWDAVRIYDSSNTLKYDLNISGDSNAITINLSSYTIESGYFLHVVVKRSSNGAVSGTIKPMIRLSSVSDAAFAPYSNVCPISGWDSVQITRTGKNLCNWKVNTTANGLSINLKPGNYVLSANGTLTSGNWYIRATDKSGDYSFSSYDLGKPDWPKSSSGWTYGGENNQSFIFTVPNDCVLIEIGKLNADGTISAMLETGETASTYEPYKGNVYPISLPTTAYGGMLKIEKDGSGTLTIDKILIVVDGTEYFSNVTANNMFYIQSDAYEELSDTSNSTDLCNMFVIAGEELQDGMINHEAESKNIYIKSSIFSGYTGEQLATYFTTNNLQLTCDLIESETITLTAEQIKTLVGENNIWTDTDNVTVSYNVREEVI